MFHTDELQAGKPDNSKRQYFTKLEQIVSSKTARRGQHHLISVIPVRPIVVGSLYHTSYSNLCWFLLKCMICAPYLYLRALNTYEIDTSQCNWSVVKGQMTS